MFLSNDNILVDYNGPEMTLEELNFLHKEGEEYLYKPKRYLKCSLSLKAGEQGAL